MDVQGHLAAAQAALVEVSKILTCVQQGVANPPKPAHRYTRWTEQEDARLAAIAEDLIEAGMHGDKLAEQLSREMGRSVAGVAARLVKIGVWD